MSKKCKCGKTVAQMYIFCPYCGRRVKSRYK